MQETPLAGSPQHSTLSSCSLRGWSTRGAHITPVHRSLPVLFSCRMEHSRGAHESVHTSLLVLSYWTNYHTSTSAFRIAGRLPTDTRCTDADYVVRIFKDTKGRRYVLPAISDTVELRTIASAYRTAARLSKDTKLQLHFPAFTTIFRIRNGD